MTEFRPSRFEILPVVIKNLLIINVLFFLAQQVFTGNSFDMTQMLALYHVKSPLFEPWQIITHMFLHGGGWHLFGNMFALWMFGSILENLWGPKRFLTFYFICGLGAALLHLGFLWYDYSDLVNAFVLVKESPTPENYIRFFNEHQLYQFRGAPGILETFRDNPTNPLAMHRMDQLVTEYTYAKMSTPTVGASGAVFGVLAAFIYLFPNTYIYLYFFVPVKAKWLGLVYFGFEIIAAVQNSAGDNIARWAHIGGGLVGFLLVLTWNKRKRRDFF